MQTVSLGADPSWRQTPWMHTSQWKQTPLDADPPWMPTPPPRYGCWIQTSPLGDRPSTLLEANPPRTCDLWCMVGSQPPTTQTPRPPPWTEGMTHVCEGMTHPYENITLPQTSFAGVKNFLADNNFKTTCEPVWSECASSRVWVGAD